MGLGGAEGADMEQCVLIAAALQKRTKRDGAAQEGERGRRGGGHRALNTPPSTPLTPSDGIEGRIRPGGQEMHPLNRGGLPNGIALGTWGRRRAPMGDPNPVGTLQHRCPAPGLAPATHPRGKSPKMSKIN